MKRSSSRWLLRGLLLLALPSGVAGCPWEPGFCGTNAPQRVVDVTGRVISVGPADTGTPFGNRLSAEQCSRLCGSNHECISTRQQNGAPAIVCFPEDNCR